MRHMNFLEHYMSELYKRTDRPWQLSVAPMLDVTDRHCRYFHRLLAPKALLYTEMVTTGALIHGDVLRHLKYNTEEHPLALQLGGSDPKDLAYCAKLAQEWGYDEVNLNCGCPSERVQKGAFGACLMAQATLVADCFKAMQDACQLPITIKHRLGIDELDSYEFVKDFVGTLFEAGCRIFISHARIAILKGLSPKENRDIPPLRYDYVERLKQDFPDALFILNGGIHNLDMIATALDKFDGVMIGRAAWHEPYLLRQASALIWQDTPIMGDEAIIEQMLSYAQEQVKLGVPLRLIVKPMLGLFNGQKGAKQWRRTLSEPAPLQAQDTSIIEQAWQALKTPY